MTNATNATNSNTTAHRMRALLKRFGFQQGWYDGGPGGMVPRLNDSLALGATRRGRGRVAFFENENNRATFILLDLPSLVWHVKNDMGRTIRRGVGYAHLVRELNTKRSS